MSLRAVNLNLLPVLQALLRERGVSRAAKALSMSQAATSEALAQLRVALNDPLLVRVGMTMVLTPRAEDLLPTLNRLCEEIEGLLAVRDFEALSAQRTFVVATTDHFVYLFGREIIQQLGVLAPHAEVHFVNWTSDMAELLAAREVHFALMPRFVIDGLASAPIRLRTLFQDSLVLIYRIGHPLGELVSYSSRDIAEYRQVLFNMDYVDEQRVQIELMGRPVARVWPLLLAPLMLPETDHVSVVPKSLALRLTRELPLRWRSLPPGGTNIDCCLAWSTLLDSDGGHQWFKLLLEDVVQRQAMSPPPAHS